jgi:hypothetical protein
VIQPKLIIRYVRSHDLWACVSTMHMTQIGYGRTPLESYISFLTKQPAYDPLLTHP